MVTTLIKTFESNEADKFEFKIIFFGSNTGCIRAYLFPIKK